MMRRWLMCCLAASLAAGCDDGAAAGGEVVDASVDAGLDAAAADAAGGADGDATGGTGGTGGAADAARDAGNAVDAAAVEGDVAPPEADVGPDAAPPCDPTPEICNGVDDDCDDGVDEGFDVGAICGVGIGACRTLATVECGPDGDAVCPAEAGAPADEACNGADDDCDGRTDEDFDGDGDGAPVCPVDPCAADCALGADACRALCDDQDCRDEDIGVFPGAEDVCGDDFDQDCDGRDAACTVATGRVAALVVAPAGTEACIDGNGDGAPDNAMGLLGAVANEGIQGAIDGGDLNLFLAAAGLAAPGTDGAFELQVLTALAVDAGGYTLDPASLGEDGAPLIRFRGARARMGDLQAGPSRVVLAVPLGDLALELTLQRAQVRGRIGVDETDGLTLTDGILWGAVPDTDLDAAIEGLLAGCGGADAPEYCGPLEMFAPLLGQLLQRDLDVDLDGTLDAYSICLTVEAAPAVLEGWPAP